MKEKLSRLFLGLSLVFIIIFIIWLIIDYINYDSFSNSTPFYAYILIRSLEFILPSLILFIISIVLKKKEEKDEK